MSGFFQNSVDEKAVEELLSQAMDATVLEQVAAINCSALNDSALPSHLETRFHNLKSLPMKPASSSTQSLINLPRKNGFSPCLKESPESKNCSYSPKSLKKNRLGELGKKEMKYRSWQVISSRSVSPPVRSGCFLCCPKQVSREKSNKDDRGLVLGLRDELILSDLSSFSVKKQEKMMKKALMEEEKICREAEKIVKYASAAMMDVSGR
ncbi:uncharacterized protein LOC105165100 [Sesamum indicum]|uniref:Uncharacterized protein LOC105165100 n=1 Tax=Sesamum indicum TaxID=4182 RepID=A0A6I9TCG2_SESIN|nr:uncharacterized protein LOC105165100 [Sesamum indicum]